MPSRWALLTQSPSVCGVISGGTRVAGVIGDPIRHSLSPAIHNAAFAAVGLDWVYVGFEVPAGGAARALEGMRALGLAGLSVTMPHKADVAATVDELTDDAAALGAVNCVVPVEGRLVGHNTDGAGFVATLRDDHGWDPEGRTALVVGAGGAARAAIRALADAGAAAVLVANRTPSRAHEAAALAGPVGQVAGVDVAGDVDLVVNATPVGMRGADAGTSPIDTDRLHPGQLVVDLVYGSGVTALVARARARGADADDGVGMLVHQAAIAFSLWTGCPAPLAVMQRAARAARAALDGAEGDEKP